MDTDPQSISPLISVPLPPLSSRSTHDDEWYASTQKELEPVWARELTALGTAYVRTLLGLDTTDGAVRLPSPPTKLSPRSRRATQFHPTRDFAIKWLLNTEQATGLKVKEEKEYTEKIQRTAIRLQHIALWVSGLSALSAFLSAARTFIQH